MTSNFLIYIEIIEREFSIFLLLLFVFFILIIFNLLVPSKEIKLILLFCIIFDFFLLYQKFIILTEISTYFIYRINLEQVYFLKIGIFFDRMFYVLNFTFIWYHITLFILLFICLYNLSEFLFWKKNSDQFLKFNLKPNYSILGLNTHLNVHELLNLRLLHPWSDRFCFLCWLFFFYKKNFNLTHLK